MNLEKNLQLTFFDVLAAHAVPIYNALWATNEYSQVFGITTDWKHESDGYMLMVYICCLNVLAAAH